MNIYLHIALIPVYALMLVFVIWRRRIHKAEALKRIYLARSVIEANKESIYIEDAKKLKQSIDKFESYALKSKSMKKSNLIEINTMFKSLVKKLNIDSYDQRTVIGAADANTIMRENFLLSIGMLVIFLFSLATQIVVILIYLI